MNQRVAKLINRLAPAMKKKRKDLKRHWNERPRNVRSIRNDLVSPLFYLSQKGDKVD